MDDVLYTISRERVKANNLRDLSEISKVIVDVVDDFRIY